MPTLIVQGTRDPFGTMQEVRAYRLAETIGITWIEGGDHDLKPLRSTGRSHADALDEAAAAVDAFLRRLPA